MVQSLDVGSDVRAVVTTARTPRALPSRCLALLQWLAVAVAVFAAVALGVLPHLGLYRTVTVLSGSMVPTFRPGDMIVVAPTPTRSLRVGDVITYQVPVGARQVETHRVVRILRGRGTDQPVIETQGDANNATDPWKAQLHGATVWELKLVVPHAGSVVTALRSRPIRFLTVFLIPLALALIVLVRLWRPEPPTGDATV